MSTESIVISNELGPEFDLGVIQANRIRLKLGTGLAIQPDGTIVATGTVTNQIARVVIGGGVINNVGSVLNTLGAFSATALDTIGITVNANSIVLPAGANYRVKFIVNLFDNNSARVAHTSFLNLNGGLVSRVFNNNYMRDATAHDNAHIDHEDFVSGGTITMDIQTHSSLLNTTTILDGYILIERK